jgi:predicted O-linked N-acetylglucosamine transferase (SPINDLY family)
VHALGDDEIESVIRRDGVDILVDLSGHFQHNRLTVFTRRPAPVQVSFPNYPGTTGVEEIDYILTDRWTTPEGSESEYAEEPYRLPSGYLVYRYAGVPLTPLPAASNGYLTFGMFQRPGKLHKGVWAVITETLRRTPESRLLIHFGSAELDEEGSGQRERLLGILKDGGVGTERIVFRGSRISPEHLAVVGEADIALDAFPFNGQTTTCDCLWMGVPVISLRGQTHVSRVTPALLDRLDLGELAAETPAGYVEQALRLAGSLERLAALRAGLREKMQERWMTGGSRLAQEIEQAYRTMWRRWCASQGRGRANGTSG